MQLVCRLQQGLPVGEPLGDPASGRQLVPVSGGLQVGACLQPKCWPSVPCSRLLMLHVNTEDPVCMQPGLCPASWPLAIQHACTLPWYRVPALV